MNSTKEVFQLWLLEKFFDYQREKKHPCSITEYGEFLGLQHAQLSPLLWGKSTPTARVFEKLRDRYGAEVDKFTSLFTEKTLDNIEKQLLKIPEETRIEYLQTLIKKVEKRKM